VVAHRAVERVTPSSEAKFITLRLDAGPNLPTVHTDANRVEQILVNLLGNAIKHAPDGGTVRITVTAQDGIVVYQFEDDGDCIPESEQERIFDIYAAKSGDESTGLGLGLPLSRQLARLLGGELRVVPRGTGRCFALELPAIKR